MSQVGVGVCAQWDKGREMRSIDDAADRTALSASNVHRRKPTEFPASLSPAMLTPDGMDEQLRPSESESGHCV